MNIVVVVNTTLGKRLRNVRQWLSWVGWLIRLVGFGWLLWGVFAGQPIAVGLGGLFVVYPELLGLVRHLFAQKYGSWFTYTLRDDGIGVKTAITNLELSWRAVRSVRETRAEWILRVAGGGLLTLPKAAISPEDATTLRTFLANRQLIDR
jgi:hypothetical protein